jgi:hypothetical protein
LAQDECDRVAGRHRVRLLCGPIEQQFGQALFHFKQAQPAQLALHALHPRGLVVGEPSPECRVVLGVRQYIGCRNHDKRGFHDDFGDALANHFASKRRFAENRAGV